MAIVTSVLHGSESPETAEKVKAKSPIRQCILKQVNPFLCSEAIRSGIFYARF